MQMAGLEPAASWSQTMRSTDCATSAYTPRGVLLQVFGFSCVPARLSGPSTDDRDRHLRLRRASVALGRNCTAAPWLSLLSYKGIEKAAQFNPCGPKFHDTIISHGTVSFCIMLQENAKFPALLRASGGPAPTHSSGPHRFPPSAFLRCTGRGSGFGANRQGS